MTVDTSKTAPTGLRHEAFLYGDDGEYADALGSFVRDGLAGA